MEHVLQQATAPAVLVDFFNDLLQNMLHWLHPEAGKKILELVHVHKAAEIRVAGDEGLLVLLLLFVEVLFDEAYEFGEGHEIVLGNAIKHLVNPLGVRLCDACENQCMRHFLAVHLAFLCELAENISPYFLYAFSDERLVVIEDRLSASLFVASSLLRHLFADLFLLDRLILLTGLAGPSRPLLLQSL